MTNTTKTIASLQTVFDFVKESSALLLRIKNSGFIAKMIARLKGKKCAAGDWNEVGAAGDGNKVGAAGNGNEVGAAGDGNEVGAAGDSNKVEVSGINSCAFACGKDVIARGSIGCGIALSEYNSNKLLSVAAAIIDGKKLLADTWYKLENSLFVRMDYSDGILSYWISDERKIGKVKIQKVKVFDGGKELYLATADGKSAHAETPKQAAADLKFKFAPTDLAKYKDYTLKTELSQADMLQLYHDITGACSGGTKNFVESTPNLPTKCTIAKAIELTRGQYGNEKFAEFFKAK